MTSAEWLPLAEGRWLCLTLVADLAADELFTAFGGGKPPQPGEVPAAAGHGTGTPDGQPAAPEVRAGDGTRGAFAIETSSAQGLRPEVLRRISRHGHAVAVGLAPDDLPRLRWFSNAALQAELVLNAPERVVGPEAARVVTLLADSGLRSRLGGFTHLDVLPGGIELAGRLVGFSVKPAHAAAAARGGVILPLLDDPVKPEVAQSAQVTAWIEAARVEAVTEAVQAQARRVAADWHLAEHPEIREWITRIGVSEAGVPAADDQDEPFPRLLRRLASASHRHSVTGPAADEGLGVRRALQALRLARVLEPREALAVLFSARNRHPGLLAELEADLGHPQPDPARIDELNQERRGKSGNRVRARAAAQHPDGALAPLGGAEAAWNWLLPLLPSGATLTFTDQITPHELLQRLGASLGDVRDVRAQDLHRLLAAEGPGRQAVAGSVQGWSFALERGPAPVGPHMLETASTGTRTVLLHHTGNGTVRFGYAEDGVLVSRFDPLVPQQREGRDPDRFMGLLLELGIDPGADAAAGAEAELAVLALYRLGARIIGARLDETAVRDATATAPLTWIPPYARGRIQPPATP